MMGTCFYLGTDEIAMRRLALVVVSEFSGVVVLVVVCSCLNRIPNERLHLVDKIAALLSFNALCPQVVDSMDGVDKEFIVYYYSRVLDCLSTRDCNTF